MRFRKIVFAALIYVVLCFCSLSVSAQEDRGLSESAAGLDAVRSSHERTSSFSDLIKSGFSYNLKSLLFFDAQYPGHSTQNPENAFLDLYRYSSELHLRPDFFLETPLFSGVFKPRMISYYRWWEDGVTEGDANAHNRVFVNEWLMQLKPHSSLFISFGKEKLLWGPSFLVSPSNILFKDTEKANPKIEIEGKYLAKLIYLPSKTLTFTAICETQKEEDQLQETVKPVRALKLDIMGSSFFASVVGYLQNARFRLGSFGQWTASDALLLYYDGIVSKGTDALYPIQYQDSPLGGTFIKKYDNSDKLFTTVTAGGAYTLLSGATLSLEFLYNGIGYDDAEAGQYHQLRKTAAVHLFDKSSLSPLSQKTLAEALNTGSPFLRRYYLMIQFQQREIKNVLDVILRYTHSPEERSGQFSTILEWQVAKRMQLFNINTIAIGGSDTEFKSVLSKSFMIGIEVHF